MTMRPPERVVFAEIRALAVARGAGERWTTAIPVRVSTRRPEGVRTKPWGHHISAFTRAPRRNTESPRVSIVIPALNEAANLAEVLPRLPDVHEVILVDGGSVDGTTATARRLMPDIVTVLQARTGKGNALASGFARVTGDIVVMFDADGSADPAEIDSFMRTLQGGADFAKGSRFAEGGGSRDITPIRTAGNRGLNAVFNLVFGTRYSDLCYGYNAFWADLIPMLDLPDHTRPPATNNQMLWGDGFEIETVINCRFAAAGVEIAEVPSVELARVHGESNLKAFRDGLRVLRTLVAEALRSRSMQPGLQRGPHGLRDLPHALEQAREPVAACN